ncbi:MAG: hypothetical protein KTM48_03610, partial [Wolbachia endosymbiont of Pissodes strobi]|nr:hypothetical protein [Wolbachia endosymbiont of Pissodes strobi]
VRTSHLSNKQKASFLKINRYSIQKLHENKRTDSNFSNAVVMAGHPIRSILSKGFHFWVTLQALRTIPT